MSIFSIFKRKPEPPATPAAGARAPRPAASSRLMVDSEAERARQRDIARATAMKIDAIESAMAFDIFNAPEPSWGSTPKRAPRATYSNGEAGSPPTLPMVELATTVLLSDDSEPEPAVPAQTAPLIEEIAIMYANGQDALAEQMLSDSLGELGQVDRAVWWMLFDLLQIEGKQDQFDSVAIDYASHFETSPPSWLATQTNLPAAQSYAGLTPTEALAGVLDAGVAPQLERLLHLAPNNPVLRLDLSRISDLDGDGCAQLLGALQRLRARRHELIVVGAAELTELIGASIEIGRRDSNPAPWLLQLELLQLLGREKEFEEAAMDYCVTYEVSPPSFEAPTHVAMAAAERSSGASDRFMLPPVIEGKVNTLLDAIDEYAVHYHPVVLDCSRLARIDYSAAGQLLARLRPLAVGGKTIEFRDVNHLVAALLRLLGFADLARLYPHKY